MTDKSEELFFPDQLVYFSSNEGDKVEDEIKLIMEFKPPHKLTLAMLRAGLRPVDIDEEVINNATVPSPESDDHFRYHSTKIVASVVTQTFSYMIDEGLEYGMFTTGEACVFMRVKFEEPGVVYYHLAESRTRQQ